MGLKTKNPGLKPGFPVVCKLHSGQLNFLLEFQYTFLEKTVGIHKILYRLATVNDRGMIAASEMFPDRFQRILGKRLRQVHGDLAGLHDLTLAGLLQELVVRNIKILTYHFLDRINGDLLAGRFYKIPEYFLGQFEVDLSFIQ